MTTYPRNHPVSGSVEVSVRLFSGNVHISGANVTEAEVDLQPTRKGDAKAEKVIERSRVEITDHSVSIDVPKPGTSALFGNTPGVDVYVVVPVGSTARVEAGSADVIVDKQLGRVEVQAGSGDVFVSDCAGTRVKTGSGDIRVDRLAEIKGTSGSGDISVTNCDGDINVNTASGDIEIDRVTGMVVATTASGDANIAEVDSDLAVKTASGDVNVGRVTSGKVGATTVSGSIKVAVADGTAAMLDCSSVTGRLTSDLDGIEAPNDQERTAAISARSVSGGIHIVRA